MPNNDELQGSDEFMIQSVVPGLLRELGLDNAAVFSGCCRITPSAENDIREGLCGRVRKTVTPSLSRLFLEYLNDKDVLDVYLEDEDDTSLSPHRDAFSKLVTADHCAFLEQKLPALLSRIRLTSDIYRSFLDEMLRRLDSDFEAVTAGLLGGMRFHELTGISVDDGDLHNTGRSSTVLTTDSGKIVYKPHDVQVDLKAYELFEAFFPDILQAPRVVAGDGYGFTEFIINEPPMTEEDAHAYFYRLGGLSAVIQMLGSTDLHHNNVLTRRSYPVIIDYELLMTPGSAYPDRSLAQELKYSVLTSSLMPSRRGSIELSILFARDEENRGGPVVNGVRKNILDDPEGFLEGFRDVYRRCLKEKESLKDFIRSMGHVFIRHIYRGTALYAELLRRSLEPGWIGDGNLRSELFTSLSLAMKRNGSDRGDAIANAEADALLRGDIPYFALRADSLDLYMDGKVVFPDFFQESCIDHVLSRISRMNEEDLVFEQELLKKAMKRVIRRVHRSEPLSFPVTAGKAVSDSTLLAGAEKIFRDIAADAVYTPSGEPCWFGPNYFLETGMQPLNGGLIEGTMGLAVFFAALRSLSTDDGIKQQAGALLRVLTDRLDRVLKGLETLDVIWPNVEDVSMSQGLAGKLLACCLIGRYTGEDRYRALGRRMVSLAERVELRFEKPDIYAGLSGILKVLCRFDELFSLEGVPRFCASLADRLISEAHIPYKGRYLWRTLSAEWPISGAGHGQSGVASALYLAGKRLERKDLIDAAMAGFEFEADIYSEKLGAWPDRRLAERTDHYITGYCSGACGIGLNALDLKYDGSSPILEKAIASVRREGVQFKDILCCGNSAMIEFLLEAGIKLGRPDLVEEARTRMALVLERAGRQGLFNCVNASVSNVYSPSLFYGTAGIGYEMLRLLSPEGTESVLL